MIIQVIWLELELSLRWTGRSSSTGLLASTRDFKTPTQYPNVGDYKGRTGLSPPTAYPSTVGYCHIRRFLCTRAPRPCTKKLPIPPRVPNPTDWQVKDIGKPEGTTNRHLNLTLLLLILVIWMFKHEVEHVKIMTSKLYASSYITIITWRQLYSTLYALLYEWYENLNLEELFIVFITKVALSSKETSSPCSSW
jgi:hypothetical protein